MAMTTYLCARAHGKQFTAIPVFPMRAFHHGAIVYNTRAGIRTPADLEGRRVGVNRGYTVTTGLWARSLLQHEYGVDLRRVTGVLRNDLLDAEPDRARDLFDAFAEAKRIGVRRLREGRVDDASPTDHVFVRVMEIAGDPLPYGLEPNRQTLEAMVQYSVEQGI